MDSVETRDDRKLNAGLLALRAGAGISLAVQHGWAKMADAIGLYHGHAWGFVEFIRSLGFPAPVFFAVSAMLSESVCAVLVACGFFTRIAAAAVTFTMAVAIFADLKERSSIEAAWQYAICFAAISLTGPGAYSFDYLLKRKNHV